MLHRCFAVAVLAALAGCGGDLPDTIPVSGKVTFGGRPPPAPGTISFQPIEAAPGYALRPASATFEADGNYQATAFAQADGLVPGKYAVHIVCWKNPPDEVTGDPGVSHVPDDYRGELVIEPGTSDPVVADFDVP